MAVRADWASILQSWSPSSRRHDGDEDDPSRYAVPALPGVGPGGDTVENGLIRTHGGMGLLYWTGGKLGNCVIRVVYKMRDSNDNSGVFIRIPVEPREEWMPVHYGYEV